MKLSLGGLRFVDLSFVPFLGSAGLRSIGKGNSCPIAATDLGMSSCTPQTVCLVSLVPENICHLN